MITKGNFSKMLKGLELPKRLSLIPNHENLTFCLTNIIES
uniref:Uncharacterized protein n=1 Tax=Arundo donax TaxID=35708 RepID=A0A0A9HIN9_ARUDO